MAKRRRKKNAMAPRQAKRTKAAMMPSVLPLPDGLVDAVFLRLPARTVAACRCVSPAWNHRLSSPAFTEVFHAFSAAAARGAPTFVSVPVDPREHDRTIVATRSPPGPSPCANPFTGGVLRLPPRRPEWLLHSAGLAYDAGAGAHKAVLLLIAWLARLRLIADESTTT
ncbi:hypothetical protein SETIT_7G064500v2 [Setaria italica]|uniref:F-box domain-containing protein n=1 Tax=Setaria italica TaxID=4555 RepID=K3YCL0_SETIT|nr:hypothetical protein SETIT_7G064500v2 [Setaria italica]